MVSIGIDAQVALLFDRWRHARRSLIRHNARPSAVHRWRICSRRLFALEELLAPATQRAERDGVRALLDAAFHAAGQLRDAQVAIGQLQPLSRRFSVAGRLAHHLRRRLPRQRERVTLLIRAIKPRAVRRTLLRWGLLRDPDEERLAARAARRLQRAHLGLRRAQSRRRSARSLHQYRVRLKSLRYMEEISRAAGWGPASQRITPRQIDRMQRKLGRIVDLEVLSRLLDRYTVKHPARRRESALLHNRLRQLPMGIGGASMKNSCTVRNRHRIFWSHHVKHRHRQAGRGSARRHR